MSKADSNTIPPIANAMYELRSKLRPLALVACRACRMTDEPTKAAKKPMQKPTKAKSLRIKSKIKYEDVEAKLVKRIMVDEVALTTAG